MFSHPRSSALAYSSVLIFHGYCTAPARRAPLSRATLRCGLRPAARAHGCRCLLKRFCVMSCLPVLAFVLLLPGCASQLAPPEPTRDDVLIHVHLVDHIDYQPGAEAFGLSRCANGVCVLHVLRERYPFCLLHELRHAFEGDWHPGRETLDDC